MKSKEMMKEQLSRKTFTDELIQKIREREEEAISGEPFEIRDASRLGDEVSRRLRGWRKPTEVNEDAA
jgi:hypothetical protein